MDEALPDEPPAPVVNHETEQQRLFRNTFMTVVALGHRGGVPYRGGGYLRLMSDVVPTIDNAGRVTIAHMPGAETQIIVDGEGAAPDGSFGAVRFFTLTVKALG